MDEARRAERAEERRTDRKRDTEEPADEASRVEEEARTRDTEPESGPQDPSVTPEGLPTLALEPGQVPTDAAPDLAPATQAPVAAAAPTEAASTPIAGPAVAGAAAPTLAATPLVDPRASLARPVSLTGPSQRATADVASDLAPGELALEAALTEDGPVDEPLGDALATEPAARDTARAPARTDVVDAVQRPTAERTAPQPAATVHEGLSTGVDAAPRRDVAAPVTPKAAPAQVPTPQVAVDRAADVLRQFRMHLSPNMRQATIHLQPANLGRIAIRISMKDGVARTEMRVETDQTLEALQRHVPELKAAFEGHGIATGEFELALGFGDETSQGSERSSDQTGNRGAGTSATPAIDEAQLASPDLHRALLDETGVDTYA